MFMLYHRSHSLHKSISSLNPTNFRYRYVPKNSMIYPAFIAIRFPSCRVTVLDSELEGRGHAGHALGQVFGHSEDRVDGGGHVVLHGGGGHLGHHLPTLTELQFNSNLLQKLISQSIGAIELKHNVSRIYVFDTRNSIFRFRLSELYWLA